MKNIRNFILILTLSCSSLFGNWSRPVTIFKSRSAKNPVVGIDAKGNAVIISTVSDNGSTFYTKAAQLIDGKVKNVRPFVPFGIAQGLHALSVNDSGQAVAVWIEYDPIEFNSFLQNSILINNKWSKVSTISDPPNYNVENFTLPGVHIDSIANSFVIWPSQNNETMNFHVHEHQISGIVVQKHQDIFNTPDFLTSVSLAGSSTGKALAVWCTMDPFTLQGAYYNGQSWNVSIVSTDLVQTGIPLASVAMNNSECGILAWNTHSTKGIHAKSFENGIFQEEQILFIPKPEENIISLKTTLNNQGIGMAAWITYDKMTDSHKIMASRYQGNVWGGIDILEQTRSKLCHIDIALDALGNALAVWEKDNAKKSHIYCQSYKNQKWLNSPQLLSSSYSSAKSPKLAMNSNGSATIVWSLHESSLQSIQAIQR